MNKPLKLLIKLIDEIIPNKDFRKLWLSISFYIIIILVQCTAKFLADYFYVIAGKRIVYDLRLKIVSNLLKLSGKYYSGGSSGELLTTINDDVAMIEEFSTKMLFSLISDVITACIMIIYLATIQLDLLLIAIVLQPILYFIHKFFNKRVHKNVSELRNCHGKYITNLEEFLTHMLNFTKQNAKILFNKKYFDISKKFLKIGVKLQIDLSLSSISTNILYSFSMVLILVYGGLKVMNDTLTLGVLIAFNTYSQQLLSPIFRIVQFKINIQKSVVAIKRIKNILSIPIEVNENRDGYKPEKINGKIEFRNVDFAYKENNLVLKDINLVCSNSVTGIVGASGSGKTTLINLIYRLWDTANGEILIDDVNIKEYNLNFLRKNISVVSQDVFIFNDSILNNITLGKTGITQDIVIQVAKIADIYDFIVSLPDGFDTLVGQNGVTLSGGQKQKVSIARALLRNAPIIIFDEATSSLDNISESRIQEKIEKYFKNKTTLVIAHRLSTVKNADFIIVLDKGEIVEKGTHEKLLEKRSVYYRLYTKQDNNEVLYSEDILESCAN